MPKENLQEELDQALEKINRLEPRLRDLAFQSITTYVQYTYAIAKEGAGPVAIPPPLPHGSSPTTGTFKCPKCGGYVMAEFT